jgi:ribonuclease BN (tRNA processing enzyme)
MAAANKPTEVTLRAYQVGFGDCFLLTFHYAALGAKPAFQRHLLIDFGSTGKPKTAEGNLLLRVAEDIKKECNGKLHAVIATHRHKDHISGFATAKNGKGSGDIIRLLKPDIVLQPWTEDPKAKPDATKSMAFSSKKAFVGTLLNIHSFSENALAEAARLKGRIGVRTSAQLAFLGEDGLANRSAIDNLMTMGKNRYLNFGLKSGLEKILPGVKVHVLGPPTIEQSAAIKKQRARDEAEFWHLQALSGRHFMAKGQAPFPRAAKYSSIPPHARWIIPRLQAIRGDQLLQIVRAMD